MITYLLAFLFFVSIVTAMAVGVILSNKPIKGSCGGLNALGMKQDCEICGKKADEIEEICETK